MAYFADDAIGFDATGSGLAKEQLRTLPEPPPDAQLLWEPRFGDIAASGELASVVPFSAKIESELAELPSEDRAEFLASLGLESAGLDRLIQAGYTLLAALALGGAVAFLMAKPPKLPGMPGGPAVPPPA